MLKTSKKLLQVMTLHRNVVHSLDWTFNVSLKKALVSSNKKCKPSLGNYKTNKALLFYFL